MGELCDGTTPRRMCQRSLAATMTSGTVAPPAVPDRISA